MAESLESQLARVQARIAAIENGASEYQSVTGMRARNHDLAVLYAREKDLINRIARAAVGNTAYMGRPTT